MSGTWKNQKRQMRYIKTPPGKRATVPRRPKVQACMWQYLEALPGCDEGEWCGTYDSELLDDNFAQLSRAYHAHKHLNGPNQAVISLPGRMTCAYVEHRVDFQPAVMTLTALRDCGHCHECGKWFGDLPVGWKNVVFHRGILIMERFQCLFLLLKQEQID